MRGRGRGTINESRGTRKPQNKRGAPRNSTWDRAPAGTSTNPVPKSLSSTNRQIKPNDQSKFQLMPSVSRSSGLEPNGDALRSFSTQEEYWAFITEKIETLEVPGRLDHKNLSQTERQEKESNVMILLRKLREGFVSTNRRDDFAMQVVEKSVYLSILYNSPVNIASSFSYLLEGYANATPTTRPESATKSAFHEAAIGLVHFLQSILDEFPSQRASYRLVAQPHSANHPTCLARDSIEWSVASDVGSALRRSNWWALERLTNLEIISERLKHAPWVGDTQTDANNEGDMFSALPPRALKHLLEQLRTKVRSHAWPVLRSAYREVVGATWLERSLLLPKGDTGGLGEFMKTAVERSEAAAKDAPEGTNVWTLRRPLVT